MFMFNSLKQFLFKALFPQGYLEFNDRIYLPVGTDRAREKEGVGKVALKRVMQGVSLVLATHEEV